MKYGRQNFVCQRQCAEQANHPAHVNSTHFINVRMGLELESPVGAGGYCYPDEGLLVAARAEDGRDSVCGACACCANHASSSV